MSISMPFGLDEAGRTLLPDGNGVTFWKPGEGMLRPTVSCPGVFSPGGSACGLAPAGPAVRPTATATVASTVTNFFT